MVSDFSFTNLSPEYLHSTQERMLRALRILHEENHDENNRISSVLDILHEQAILSRRCGCASISRLCESVQYCIRIRSNALEIIGESNVEDPFSLAEILLGVCGAIQVHAIAVARTAAYLRH
jgi:hypothetical protein